MRNTSGHQCKELMSGSEKSEREHVLHFLHKKGFWKLLVVVVQNKGKEMYKKVFCTCKVAFFAN